MMSPYKKIFSESSFSEASIGSGSIAKVCNLYSKLIGKRLGKKLYGQALILQTFKDPTGMFKGAKYFIGGGEQAIRFNFSLKGGSADIESVDIWNQPGYHPDLKIPLAGFNVVEILDFIVEVIVSGQAQKRVIAESRKAAPLSLKERVTLKNIVETWAKDQDSRDLHNTKLNLLSQNFLTWYQGFGGEKPSTAPNVNSAYNAIRDYLVTSGIGNRHFRNVAAVPAGRNIPLMSGAEAQLNQQLSIADDPDLAPLTPDEIFQQIRTYLQMICDGVRPSLVITGDPGIGKSYSIYQDPRSPIHKTDYVVKKGVLNTALKLYRAMFENNGKIIIFDDIDSVLKDKDAVNILKAGLDSYDVREIEYPNRDETLPPRFEFTGRIIFISNMYQKQMDSAILSRSLKVEIDFTFEQIMERIRNIVDKIDAIKEVPREIKEEVIEFIISKRNIGHKMDIRTFNEIVLVRISGLPTWRKICTATIKELALATKGGR